MVSVDIMYGLHNGNRKMLTIVYGRPKYTNGSKIQMNLQSDGFNNNNNSKIIEKQNGFDLYNMVWSMH